MKSSFPRKAVLIGVAIAMAAAACQERPEPTVSLTQEQWKRVKQYIHDEPPQPERPVGAVFGSDGEPLIELVGYDVEPDTLVTNKEFKVTWHWHALDETDTNWKVFVHLTPEEGGAFQNLDHHPVDSLYQTSLWEEDQYVTDTQTAKLQAGFPSRGGNLYIGLFDERSGERLQVIEPGEGNVVEEGKLEVGRVGTQNDKHLVAYKVEQAPKLDGLLNDPVWRRAERTVPFVDPVSGKAVNFSTTARAIYTDDAIYFAFEARDRDIRTTWKRRDDKLWEQDTVEIFLNPDNDEGTYWEIQVSPGEGEGGKTPIFDAYFEKHRHPAWEVGKAADVQGMEVGLRRQGSLNSASKRPNDTMYTLEIKIPFADLQTAEGAIDRIKLPRIPPREGTTWRVNLFRVDYGYSGPGKPQTRHASWSPSGGDFHNLSAFGTIEFGPQRGTRTNARRPRTAQKRRAQVRTSLIRTRFVETRSITRASRASQPRLVTCFEKAETPPEARTEFRFEVSVSADAKVAGIQRVSQDARMSQTISCIEKVVGGWQNLKLRPPRVNGKAREAWKPSEAENIGFTMRVIYTPPRDGPAAGKGVPKPPPGSITPPKRPGRGTAATAKPGSTGDKGAEKKEGAAAEERGEEGSAAKEKDEGPTAAEKKEGAGVDEKNESGADEKKESGAKE